MKILIAGDFCDKFRVTEVIARKEYNTLFSNVRDIINSADYSIVNFEFPIVATVGKPIAKCGPNLKGQPASVDAIKYAGFNCCTLANNHILDQGEECLLDTKYRLDAAGIKTVGAGENLSAASEILYLEKEGQKVAVINCCEHEFTIATDNTAGANPLNPIQQFYKIQEARHNADYVLIIVHGGHEHYQLPSPRMKETYRFFVDAGADAVVNHHQHCYSGYEIYKEKPIFYGIGNFLFDREGVRHSIWNEGYMVELNFAEDSIQYELIPYVQGNEQLAVQILTDKSKFHSTIAEMNRIIADDDRLSSNYNEWIGQSTKFFRLSLEPYFSKIGTALYMRNLLPSFINNKKRLRILNYIECEAHLDRLKYILKKNLR